MKRTQSTAVESNANSAIEHIDYMKALSPAERTLMRDAQEWEELQEEMELGFIRNETLNKGRAFANNHDMDNY